MSVGLQQTIKDLLNFGLSYLQSVVYMTSVKLGTSRVSEIARVSKINRAEVYRILKTLQVKGLVEISYGRPIKYIPTPPEKAIAVMLQQYGTKLSNLELEKNGIITRLKSIEGKRESEKVGFIVILGRKKTYDKIIEMISKSKMEVLYATSAKGLKRESEAGIMNELKKCNKRGIVSKLITEINEINMREAKHIKNYCELRHLNKLPSHLLIVDNKEVIVGAIVEENRSKKANTNINFWTNSKDFIVIIKAAFEEFWQKSSSYSKQLNNK